ncbi:MAG: hypothetical protein O3A55_07265 [Bacteroidetes bacterium]|nr:hypothetical protein [Bacteroidota bacterium]
MKFYFFFIISFFYLDAQNKIDYSKPIIDQIGIKVENKERQFSFTNKEAGTYYGDVISENKNSWMGWYVNTQKILQDYTLSTNGRTLDRQRSTAIVYPHFFERKYGNILTERFTFYDSLNIIRIEFTSNINSEIIYTPRVADDFILSSSTGSELLFSNPNQTLPFLPSKLKIFSQNGIVFKGSIKIKLKPNNPTYCFLIASGDASELSVLSKLILIDHKKLFAKRKERMEKIINRSLIITNNNELNKAFYWSLLSSDALIMNQVSNGKPTKGIFAGLPWFNNYWGRDSFISLPGATWLFGNSNDAREIFKNFAKFQDSIITSNTFGRIPNQITTTSLSYNTADATQRFVIGLWEYFKHTGDTLLLNELFPTVRRSIDGTFQHRVDVFGFLNHDDADTWMDAKLQNKSWSPRGNRANDVQALWYFQLLASSEIAKFLGDTNLAQSWSTHAKKVKSSFNIHFVNKKENFIYDHINPENSPSPQIRPNQLFSLELVEDYIIKTKTLHKLVSELVFEHGTSTLKQTDTNFHPFHNYEDFYPQDAAYHNGTVWNWLNGPAITALCNTGGQEVAYKLTQNMVHQILDRGCVGTLSELVDAHPKNFGGEPNLSGAFSQAWSVSEFNRNLIQDFFGISVNVIDKNIIVAPSLPSQLHSVVCNLNIENQNVTISLNQIENDSVVVTSNNLPDGYKILQKVRVVKKRTGWSFAKPKSSLNWSFLIPLNYYKLSNSEVKQEPKNVSTLFNVNDPPLDDKGDSLNYIYPKNKFFESGILDIINAKVSFDSDNFYVNLSFRNLVNPLWHPEYGFQLTFAAIALQTDSIGSNILPYNSNYQFNNFNFNRLILVGGGIKVVDQFDATICEYNPKLKDVSNTIGNVKKKEISFSIPLKFIGKPSNSWKMKILVGAQDDGGALGLGQFRNVDSLQSEWNGGGKKFTSQPNIYDILETN